MLGQWHSSALLVGCVMTDYIEESSFGPRKEIGLGFP